MKKIIDYESWVGKKVFKVSRRTFKSSLLFNTVKGIIQNPFQSGKFSFIFEEDDSSVACFMCRLKENNE